MAFIILSVPSKLPDKNVHSHQEKYWSVTDTAKSCVFLYKYINEKCLQSLSCYGHEKTHCCFPPAFCPCFPPYA